MIIREEIEKHLEANGINKAWLARQVGISPQLLQKWLKGAMKVDSLEKICDALGLEVKITKK